jgi:hypothetical protein
MRTSKYSEALQKEMAELCEEHGPRRTVALIKEKHGLEINPGLILWYFRKWSKSASKSVRWQRSAAKKNAG